MKYTPSLVQFWQKRQYIPYVFSNCLTSSGWAGGGYKTFAVYLGRKKGEKEISHHNLHPNKTILRIVPLNGLECQGERIKGYFICLLSFITRMIKLLTLFEIILLSTTEYYKLFPTF